MKQTVPANSAMLLRNHHKLAVSLGDAQEIGLLTPEPTENADLGMQIWNNSGRILPQQKAKRVEDSSF